MKLTPEQWLTKDPARVKWAEGYFSRKGATLPPFLNQNHERSSILAKHISSGPEKLFKNLKSAYAKAKSTEKHESKTFNVTLDGAAYRHLQSLTGKGSMQAMIRLILSDLGNTKVKLEAALKKEIQRLEKIYADPETIPPRRVRVNSTQTQDLIKYCISLVTQDLYVLCRLRYLHERQLEMNLLTDVQKQEIHAIHEQKLNDLNTQLSFKQTCITLEEQGRQRPVQKKQKSPSLSIQAVGSKGYERKGKVSSATNPRADDIQGPPLVKEPNAYSPLLVAHQKKMQKEDQESRIRDQEERLEDARKSNEDLLSENSRLRTNVTTTGYESDPDQSLDEPLAPSAQSDDLATCLNEPPKKRIPLTRKIPSLNQPQKKKIRI